MKIHWLLAAVAGLHIPLLAQVIQQTPYSSSYPYTGGYSTSTPYQIPTTSQYYYNTNRGYTTPATTLPGSSMRIYPTPSTISTPSYTGADPYSAGQLGPMNVN